MLEALGEASPFVAMWRRVSFCIAAMGSIWFPNAGCFPFNSAQPFSAAQLDRVRLYRRCAPFFRPMLLSMIRSWTLLLRLSECQHEARRSGCQTSRQSRVRSQSTTIGLNTCSSTLITIC